MTYPAYSSLCRLYPILMAGFSILQSDYPKGTCYICCNVNKRYDIKFMLYTIYNPDVPQYLYLDDLRGLYNTNFDFQQHLAIYIHGFGESPTERLGSSQQIKEAFLRSGHTSVIIVDWCLLASAPWFTNTIENIPRTGTYVAEFIFYLLQCNFPIENIHLIGFGLGAEVAGYAGRKLCEWNIHLRRITALDPAYHLFSNGLCLRYLTPRVAKFVTVIHTDAGLFGNNEDLGHADFYPNGGRALQPGCVRQNIAKGDWMGIISCSHIRAWKYFVESIRSPYVFKADRCQPSKHYRICIDLNNHAFMGMGADSRLRGKFYLRTNSRSPYGKHIVQPALG